MRPERTSGSSSTSRTLDDLAHGVQGRVARAGRTRPSRRSVLELAAGERDPLCQADEPGARRIGRAGLPATPIGLLLTTATTSAASSFGNRDFDCRLQAHACAHSSAPPGRCGTRFGRGPPVPLVAPRRPCSVERAMPASARLLDQRRELRERRLRGLHRSFLGLVAKDTDDVAELLERRLSPFHGSPRRPPVTSSGDASGRNSSAPAWTLSSESRWARTSCISRAMRRRSASRAWLTRSRCSDSSRSARSRSERMTFSLRAGEKAPAKRHRN